MSYRGAQALDEHTGTTDDTHVLGTDAVAKRGFLVGILITRAGAAAATITVYDTSIATAAGAFAAERVIAGPMEVQVATVQSTPYLVDLSSQKLNFANGLGIDLSAADIGCQLIWSSS